MSTQDWYFIFFIGLALAGIAYIEVSSIISRSKGK